MLISLVASPLVVCPYPDTRSVKMENPCSALGRQGVRINPITVISTLTHKILTLIKTHNLLVMPYRPRDPMPIISLKQMPSLVESTSTLFLLY